MKLRILIGVGVVIAGMGVWFGLYPADWQQWLGFSKAAYFSEGTNYAFASGVGPMLLTATGMSTIVGSLWRAHNCHEDGCYKIGRHKVNGTPWCDVHHENARHEKTTEQLLAEILEELRGNGARKVTLQVQGGASEFSEQVAEVIRDYIRRRGGNGPDSVQRALG